MKRLSQDEIKAAADRAEARADGKTDAKEFVAVALTEGEINAEIAKLAALPPGVYETERVATAKRLAMRAAFLDKLVAAARPRPGDKGHGSAIELATRPPAEAKVDGSALLTGIIRHLEKHVYLPSNEKAAVALWVVACHAFDAFYIFPRLRLKSATKGCGKSTLLDVIEHLVNRPLIPSNVTGPSLFRVIAEHRPTMLLDEADRYAGNDDLISIVNAGHKKNGTVLRCVGDEQEVRAFPVWSPMAIAAIKGLTGTIEHRSIMISMERKPPGTKLKRFRGDRPDPELAVLASQAARWAADHRVALGNADPAMPDQLSNRAADNWLPLLAVADAVGGDWPDRARKAAEIQQVEDDELSVRLITDVREIFTSPAMHSRDLVAALNEQEGAPWATISRGHPLTQNRMARMLSDFGIRPEQIRIGGTNLHGYRLVQFATAFAAYPAAQSGACSADTPFATVATATALETRGNSRFQPLPTEPTGSGLEPEIPEQEQSGSGVAVVKGGGGAVGHGELDIPPFLRRCAQCGGPADHQPLRQAGDGSRTAWLHRRCEVAWLADDDAPARRMTGRAISDTPEDRREPTLGPPDDDLNDIDLRWGRQ